MVAYEGYCHLTLVETQHILYLSPGSHGYYVDESIVQMREWTQGISAILHNMSQVIKLSLSFSDEHVLLEEQ